MMRIAVIGTRGIPTTQGGVERHVEELYARLATKHQVTVYCRNSYTPPSLSEHRGIKLRRLPHINSKHLDAISHTFLSACDAIRRNYDIIHFHSIGPSLLSFLPKIKRRVIIVSTVHALDWKQKKWHRLAKATLKLGEKASVTFPDRTITVSKEIQAYLLEKYGRKSVNIPNGISPPIFKEPNEISKFLLKKNKYILFVGRLIPEKNCALLIEVFRNIDTDLNLVIAGSPSHTDGHYHKLIRQAKGDKRIIFTGLATDHLLQELYTNAYLFVLPSIHEGLPIALLEALSYGLPTLCSDIKPHLEVIGLRNRFATVFESNNAQDLKTNMISMIADRNAVRKKAREASTYIINTYDWDKIAQRTESTYEDLLRQYIHIE